MPEIGSALREARIRQGIEIRDAEDATKIRMKYLRALEAEEFGTLPGSVYVISFLRTYSDFLGLDSNLLVERFRAQQGEEDDEEEPLPAYADEPVYAGERRRRGRREGGFAFSRGWAIALLAVALIVFLLVLGLTGGGR